MKFVLTCGKHHQSLILALALWLPLTLFLTGCQQQLLGTLDEPTANQVMSALRQEGIDASKSPSGEKDWKVSVPDDQFSQAVQILERNNLPAQNFQGLGQVFKRESLVSTPTEERARLIYAMSQELERSLMAVDGILIARVHPVILPSDPLNPKQRGATASVLVKYRAGSDIQNRESMIRSLVAAGIEGLSYDDVRVAMVPAAPTSNVRSAAPLPVAQAHWQAQAPWYGGALIALAGIILLVYLGRRRARNAKRLSGRWVNTLDTVLGTSEKASGAMPRRTP